MQEDQSPDNPTVTSSAPPPSPARRQVTLPGFWQSATLVLIVAVAVMAFLWKPWEPNIKASERTITVTGTATVSAAPDEYTFSPSYRFTGADKQTALSAMTAKSNSIVKQLKSLGVADKDIKTNSDGYNDYYYSSSAGKITYTLSLTVTIDGSKLAQKVQDYLLTTGPIGTVSPYVSFSKAKKEELQNKARDKAEKDARTKADQSASNLGFKVDTVKSVKDGDLGGVNPYYGVATAQVATGANSATPHLNLQPGQNDLSYSVRVVYYIR